MDRCHVHALGQREGPPVRVPAIQDGPSSTAEDRSVTRSEGDFDRSTAAGSVVVSRVDGCLPRRSDPALPQIYTRGNSAGHPEGEGPFQASCRHNVKVPSGIFTASVRIPLVKIRGVR